MNQFYTFYESPVGQLLLVGDECYLKVLSYSQKNKEINAISQEVPILTQTKKWLDTYFNRRCPKIFSGPLLIQGTPFQKDVWQILRQIPYGQLVTYGAIAQQICLKTGQSKMSAQAVGRAVGCNPIAIIIPCHRVIGSTGHLTGYVGGLEIKKKLLQIEQANITSFFHKKDNSLYS